MDFQRQFTRTAAGSAALALACAALMAVGDGRAAAATGPEWVINVSQESAPGAGDFDKRFLGTLRPFEAELCAEDFYGYGDACYCGCFIKLRLAPDLSQIFFAQTTEGITMMLVHDEDFMDPDGGTAEMSFDVIGDPDGAFRSVYDDPESIEPDEDVYTGNAGDSFFTSRHRWGPCCTDGEAISGLGAGPKPPVYGETEWVPVSVIVQFTEVDGDPETLPLSGLAEWNAVSANGVQVPLALEEGRRVRFDLVQSCTNDIDGDGLIGFNDLLSIISNWGPCP